MALVKSAEQKKKKKLNYGTTPLTTSDSVAGAAASTTSSVGVSLGVRRWIPIEFISVGGGVGEEKFASRAEKDASKVVLFRIAS